ncbi:regulator of chromosome condensation 1/beta-lactamase-inhibitor protein II [Mycena alexandri]|uniref:Regulator of chromosome condensation 1/beta-lactamase-inhibitor protein II n=1 Tax=Mycena alexandri TaxID=1745969 RepID=A0AAD6XFX7_9AGAR|nr:regulator of chromosome condensation 1/beta-lactamase-inhibitor protein II [Mycena alexandri]
MLKGARGIRRLHRAARGPYRKLIPNQIGLLTASSVLAASALWYSQHTTIHNDAPLPFTPEKKNLEWSGGFPSTQNKTDTLTTLVWGSNRASVLSPLLPGSVTIKKPFAPDWLNDVALRDLALHEDHAACVDARGDVYQWGEGYASRTLEDGPTRTLSGKDIIKLQLSNNRVFALSKSGTIYILDANASKQVLDKPISTWWKFWASPQRLDFAQLTPQTAFGWGEKFTSISAGRDHLLALTSTGRTFSCPINKNANVCGQLGFNAPSLVSPYNVPKSLASSSYDAATSLGPATDRDSQDSDDSGIRFCTTLYEIPILKGVEMAQVTAGARSSFARTPSGKVLAWGANEHGQLGLGTTSISDVITIPSEVVLWPTRSQQATTRCLDVSAGGDLTGYTIERTPANDEATIVELLMCGDGQWGGLGNNVYSSAQVSPLRVKTISGLVEYNDATRRRQSIPLRSISISPTGHVLATLEPVSGDRDVHAWGRNQDYELGNGKKAGVSSPMPVVDASNGRLLLQRKRAREVRDLEGRICARGIEVEQDIAVGCGCSSVYWRLV